MEHLPVVVGGVLPRGEIGGQAELLEHDGAVERAAQLAGERRREVLPDRIVVHRVDVGPTKSTSGARARSE